jgi:hypothetical protein
VKGAKRLSAEWLLCPSIELMERDALSRKLTLPAACVIQSSHFQTTLNDDVLLVSISILQKVEVSPAGFEPL